MVGVVDPFRQWLLLRLAGLSPVPDQFPWSPWSLDTVASGARVGSLPKALSLLSSPEDGGEVQILSGTSLK